MERVPRRAPGVYPIPDEPIRALTGARMDVCAFVGVAPRGPARPSLLDAEWTPSPDDAERPPPRSVAVAVESFDAYRRLFGGFEGPGLLPYAVASFFEQGGIRAYVVRVVHDYRDAVKDAGGVARATLAWDPEPGAPVLATRSGVEVNLLARSEGAWGNKLSARLAFTTRALSFVEGRAHELVLEADHPLTAGALLRLTTHDGSEALRYVASIHDVRPPETAARRAHATFDFPLATAPERAEIVEGVLSVNDGDGRTESMEGVGLSSSHPRWLANVLHQESILLHPDEAWRDADLDLTDARLPALSTDRREEQKIVSGFSGGVDRYPDLVPEDFFGDWVPGDPPPGAGIHAILALSDVASLCVPDLYAPVDLPPAAPVAPAPSGSGEFERCLPPEDTTPREPPPPGLDGLRLDPTIPGDLAVIVGLQQRVVELAEATQTFVALLDVPPRLHHRRILRWRENFRSAYAAAYHPWLRLAGRDLRADTLVRVNPSAIAAGIIAGCEHVDGIPRGPANVIAVGVVDVDDAVSPGRHDELHPLGINVYLRDRDGVRLTAARTLSRDPAYRQLSVRRLVTMLRRTLDQEMQWAVFEPNNASLRADLRHMLGTYLRRLYRANAFRGASEDEAFFVRCDDELNPQRVVDAGQLIVEIGVAPAEPLEFVMLRVTRDGDGALVLEG